MADWKAVRYGDVTTNVRTRARGDADDEQLLSVTAANGVIGQMHSGRRDISAADKSKYLVVESGDVVYNTMRMWQGVSGFSEMHGIVSPAYTILRPSEQALDGHFLAHLMKLPCNIRTYRAYSQGLVSDTWNLKFGALAGLELEIPSLEEQRRIVEVLDTIDKTIQATEDIITKLELSGRALLSSLILQRPTNGESVPLSSTGTWLSGGTPSTEVSAFWGGPIPWITASSLCKKYLSHSSRTLTLSGAMSGSRLVPEGTLICVVRGMSLKSEFRVGIAQVELAFGQDCKALRTNKNWLPEYLYLQLIARESNILKMVDEASHGTGRLQMSLLGALEVDFVPLPEQERLVSIFQAHEHRVASERVALTKLRQTRAGIASDLLSGRVRTVAA